MFLYILFPFQLSKMAMKNLVEGECGVTNSLLKFSSHFTQDKGFKQVSQYKTFFPLYQNYGCKMKSGNSNKKYTTNYLDCVWKAWEYETWYPYLGMFRVHKTWYP